MHAGVGAPAFLGGGEADLFTLLVGALSVAVLIWTRARTRAAGVNYHQSVGSTSAFVGRMVVAGIAIMYFVLQLSKSKGLPYVLFILAILVLVYSAVMNRSVFGRHVYAIGGNLHAAELSGIRVKSVTFWVFVNIGVLAALAGIVFAARLNLANPTNGTAFRTRRHCGRIHRRCRGDRRSRPGDRRHRRWLDRRCAEQRHVDPGRRCRYQQVIKGLVLLGAVAFDVYSKRRSGGG